jgi:hypothetical protein
LKWPEENIGKPLEDTGIDKAFLTRTPIPQDIRPRIDKGDCIKLQSICTGKETTTRIKRFWEWVENLCQLFIR